MNALNRQQNVSFGMSQIRNLKLLARDSKITKEAAEQIAQFAKKVQNDGKNIVLDMVDISKHLKSNKYIAAELQVEPPPLIFNNTFCAIIQGIAEGLKSKREVLAAEYNPVNPVQAFEQILKFAENTQAKTNILKK